MKRYNWDEQTKDIIDWDICQETFDKKPIHQMTNIIKYIYGWQHVGRQKSYFSMNQTR